MNKYFLTWFAGLTGTAISFFCIGNFAKAMEDMTPGIFKCMAVCLVIFLPYLVGAVVKSILDLEDK